MKILAIVSFTEIASTMRNPSPHTGVWALVTEDESFLALHGKNKKRIPVGTGPWCDLENVFFSEWGEEKVPMGRYPNKGYRPIAEVLAKHDPKSFDRIVFFEV